jgi:peptide/nickel transport system permease protein
MAFFYVISLCVIIANIVADLLYGIIDPRIKVG